MLLNFNYLKKKNKTLKSLYIKLIDNYLKE